ncbi:MAG: alpha/beta fold hydrolase [Balneolaceae bacterium]|nr:alpha/beta fold hydrolase [Balneolaceae bacterium]
MTFETITKTSGSVPSTEDLPIRYDLYVPGSNSQHEFPVIIFLHGFKGFKDWGTFPAVCEELCSLGFAVVAMNFSLNGIGENKMEFDRLDLFARQTLSQDLDDVGSVIEALQSGEITTDKARLNTDEIGILGHSRGGHTAVAAAAEYTEIVCLVTWSAVVDYNARWSDEMIKDWETRGVTEIKNGRTGQIMPVKKVVYEDALANADRVIALNRIKKLHIPSLFVHSKDDEAVSYHDAEKLYKASPSEDKELKLVQNTGHTFGGTHPFEDEEFPEPLADVMEATGKWFQYYLQ